MYPSIVNRNICFHKTDTESNEHFQMEEFIMLYYGKKIFNKRQRSKLSTIDF